MRAKGSLIECKELRIWTLNAATDWHGYLYMNGDEAGSQEEFEQEMADGSYSKYFSDWLEEGDVYYLRDGGNWFLSKRRPADEEVREFDEGRARGHLKRALEHLPADRLVEILRSGV